MLMADILRVLLLQRPVKYLMGHVLFKSSSVSRNRTRRSSTVIAGSSTPLVPSLNPTVGCRSLSTYYILNLAVCILLDVGTKPTGTSIYELWKCKTATISMISYLNE